MAIKVRHDGNNAAVITAGVGSGRAKRRVETAKFAQNQPQHIQTLQPAHASAPGVGGGSAPLTHAPTGASVASAPLTHAPTPTGTGGVGSRSSMSRGSSAGGDLGEVKVTGTSIFTRPDNESQWNPSTLRWERPWLPGEKEAEAAQRMNPVLAERAETQQALADKSMEGRLRLQGEIADQKMREEYALRAQQGDVEAQRKMQEWDRQHGILRQERDADLIAAGTHEYGYSPDVQREYDALMKEYNEGKMSGDWDGEAEALFTEELQRKIGALPKTLVPRNDPEGRFRRDFFTDEKGRLIHVPSGKMVDSPEQMEQRRLEFQQKQMDAIRQAADRLYSELKKPRLVSHKVIDPYSGDERYEKAYEERSDDEVMRIMQQRYPQLYPTTQNGGSPTPSTTPNPGEVVDEIDLTEQGQREAQAQRQDVSDWKKKLGW